ncbi:ParB/RepB/Spo0J family partition protein [Streptomyces sp. enrichment culture]|uniref:ParB/RepB/Spo0J family partition protein n=1 Tax=Streptomyces sp. enrichment culture TaxID=1795815 RepID=UPI003F5710EB
MSKADQLGAGRFGGGVRSVSARRQAVAAATGVPTEGIAPPTELPVHRISPNPDNPRSTLGDLSDLAGSLKTHGQKQAITVMNRDAYVKANPSHEAMLEPDATHVVIDGSSRLAAAREAGLATVKVMVSDEQGATAEELLESALVANIHRQDLEELDEARALQRLLAIHGSQRALAKRLHRSQGWVSQRLALLNLTPELQARIGEEPIDLLRAVGNKPAEEQEAALQELKQQREQEREKRGSESRPGPRDYAVIIDDSQDGSRTGSRSGDDREGQEQGSGGGDYAVITEGAEQERPSDYGVISEAPASGADVVPEPRTDSAVAGEARARRVPYDQPGALAMLLNAKVDSDDLFFDLLRFLSMRALERDPARLGELAKTFVKEAQAKVG